MLKSVLQILVFFLMSLILPAQRYEFDIHSVEDGLSQSSVTCIAQDEKGFIWIGTRDGLNRYDGYEIKVFRKIPFDTTSMESNIILSLYAKSSAEIWVGTKIGLQVYDAKKDEFISIILGKTDPPLEIRLIYQDQFGGMWIGTQNGFFSVRRNPDGNSYSVQPYLDAKENSDQIDRHHNIYAVFHDDQDNFWVATGNGLYRYHYQEENGIEIGQTGGLNPENFKISNEKIQSIKSHTNGLIFSTSSGKLMRFDTSRSELVNLFHFENRSNRPIVQIVRIDEEQLMLATPSGLQLINYDGPHITSDQFIGLPVFGISQNRHKINYVLEDRIYEGLYWLATDIGGLVKMAKRNKEFEAHPLYEIPNLKVDNPYFRHIVATKEHIWINLGSGILEYSKKTKGYEYIQDFVFEQQSSSSQSVTILFESQNKRVFAGVQNVLLEIEVDEIGKYQNAIPKLELTCLDRVSAIVEIGDYFLLGGKGGDMSIIHKESFERINCVNPAYFSGLPSQYEITSLVVDQQSNLWVGTSKGLIVFRNFSPLKAFSPNPFYFSYSPTDTSGLIEDRITNVMADTKNNLWICTRNGLMRANISDHEIRLHRISSPTLQNQVIYGIVEDNPSGHLWMSTNVGIFRFIPDSEEIHQFNVNDGLPGNEFNTASFFQSDRGEIIFGGPKGFINFFPQHIELNKTPPPTWFTELETTGNDRINLLGRDASKPLSLSFAQRSFTLNFVGLDFLQAEDLNYFYSLEGRSSLRNVPLGKNKELHFSQLEPGNYKLHISAVTKDGAISQNDDTLTFVVKGPFWRMMWFYLLMTGVIILLFWLVFYIRYRYKANKLAVIEEVRKNISEDFHDELGSKLSIISMYSEFARKDLLDSNGKTSKYLEKVNATAGRLYENARDLIWVLNPIHDTLYDLFIQLKDFGEDLFMDTNINFHSEGVNEAFGQLNLPLRFKRHILLIFKEAMHNALKHANCNNVSFSIEQNKEHLHLVLKDDGQGFPEFKEFNGEGLNNMKHRSQQIHSKLSIYSDISGTHISLAIHKENLFNKTHS